MKLIERECPVCSTIYLANPTRLKHGREIACSRKCSYEFRAAKKRRGVELECGTCGAKFTRPLSHLKGKHGSHFCSRQCHYAGRTIGATKRVVTKPYEYTPEGKASLIANARKPKGKRVFHYRVCANCGETFECPSNGRKRKSGLEYCSLECCNAHRKGENNPAWRGGYLRYYGPDWRALRRAARKRDNDTCQRCNQEREPDKPELDVHHIRPVGSFENRNDANTLDNVITLCHPCHMHVEWNGLDFEPHVLL